MVSGDPTGFYERSGYEVTGQDRSRPHILTMRRRSVSTLNGNGSEPTLEVGDVQTIAQNAPGTRIPAPGGTVTPSPAVKARPLGMYSVEEVKVLAARLRALGDDELVALAHGAWQFNLWQQRQRAARERRLERERLEAATAAGQHLDPHLTGEARARVARARAGAGLADMFGSGGNGAVLGSHSE
jgi:hypothetical protein